MRNFEEIFKGLPEYVGDVWWQEFFAKRFEGTLKGSYHNVSSVTLRILAEKMKDGLERASAEASDFIGSVNVEGDITRWFEICPNLALEICPHIDIVRLSLSYYQSFNKWAVEIIGGNTEIGYQCSHSLICIHESEVRDFLASDEFVVVSMHRLFECEEELADCEREVRHWRY